MAAAAARSVLVTGANRGLGLDLTRRLARQPDLFRVFAAARSWEAAGAAAPRRELEAAGGVLLVTLDVASPASIAALASIMRSALDGAPLALLVNNAGAWEETWSAEALARMVETNTAGTVRLARALKPLLSRGSSVVNVASALGRKRAISPTYAAKLAAASSVEAVLEACAFIADDAIARAYASSYCLSKNALVRVSQLLGEEWGREGIRVVAADPGWCKTDMGGAGAPRTSVQGAESLYKAAMADGAPSGAFLSTEGAPMEW